MITSENRAKALKSWQSQESKPQNQPTKNDLKKEKEKDFKMKVFKASIHFSSFVVGANGLLYHRALPGLELNAVRESLLFQDLSFGHGE